MSHRIASALLPFFCAVATPALAVPLLDPVGDTIQPPQPVLPPDIVAADVIVGPSTVRLEVEFAATAFPPKSLATFGIDVDQDPTTGFSDSLSMGIEFSIRLSALEVRVVEIIEEDPGFALVATGPTPSIPNGFAADIDRALFGDDDGLFTFAVAAQFDLEGPGVTSFVTDFVPNHRGVSSVVPEPGAALLMGVLLGALATGNRRRGPRSRTDG